MELSDVLLSRDVLLVVGGFLDAPELPAFARVCSAWSAAIGAPAARQLLFRRLYLSARRWAWRPPSAGADGGMGDGAGSGGDGCGGGDEGGGGGSGGGGGGASAGGGGGAGQVGAPPPPRQGWRRRSCSSSARRCWVSTYRERLLLLRSCCWDAAAPQLALAAAAPNTAARLGATAAARLPRATHFCTTARASLRAAVRGAAAGDRIVVRPADDEGEEGTVDAADAADRSPFRIGKLGLEIVGERSACLRFPLVLLKGGRLASLMLDTRGTGAEFAVAFGVLFPSQLCHCSLLGGGLRVIGEPEEERQPPPEAPLPGAADASGDAVEGGAGGGALAARRAPSPRQPLPPHPRRRKAHALALGCHFAARGCDGDDDSDALSPHRLGRDFLAAIELGGNSQAVVLGCDVGRGFRVGVLVRDDASPRVLGCRVRGCLGDGVQLEGGASGAFRCNELGDNGGAGLSMRLSRLPLHSPLVARNWVRGNAEAGISAEHTDAQLGAADMDEDGAPVAVLRANCVSGNREAGICVADGACASVFGNQCSANGGPGIALEDCGEVWVGDNGGATVDVDEVGDGRAYLNAVDEGDEGDEEGRAYTSTLHRPPAITHAMAAGAFAYCDGIGWQDLL